MVSMGKGSGGVTEVLGPSRPIMETDTQWSSHREQKSLA